MKGEGSGRLEEHSEYKLLAPEKSATIRDAEGKNEEYISSSTETGVGSAVLFFSDAALEQLKRDVSPSPEGEGEGKNWISTQDALSTLLWSCIIHARSIALGPQAERQTTNPKDPLASVSMFNAILNARGLLSPIPEAYTGNVLFVTKAFLPPSSLIFTQDNLSNLPQTVRASINDLTSPLLKDKIAAVKNVDDIGRLVPSGYNSGDRNVGCSSWVRQRYYELDWASVLGGRIQRMRWRRGQ
ncbi:hypothetical protein G7Y89_g15010 [Cudoniella acicularis]|uniref:Uncharacterized protein n=1 Tax=Cudoniella acicularis TaxID=354080 RepID=A0A8H4QW55_9HELO|nr:hypothetical protein G7Y89_g15010 [Cudoniella acicularis]